MTVSPFTQHEKYKAESTSYGTVVSHNVEIQVYSRTARCKHRMDKSIKEARTDANMYIRERFLEFVSALERYEGLVVRVNHDI